MTTLAKSIHPYNMEPYQLKDHELDYLLREEDTLRNIRDQALEIDISSLLFFQISEYFSIL